MCDASLANTRSSPFRYPLNQYTREITLVTTLLDPQKYPAEELAALYGQRWRIETNLNQLKTTMGMDVLRCESVAGVLKELTIYSLVYNLVRLVMLKAAEKPHTTVRSNSFVDALRWPRPVDSNSRFS